MKTSSRLTVALKSLFQLGPEPLALNALYKFGLLTGHYRRTENRGIENREQFTTLHSLFSPPSRKDIQQVLGKDGKTALLKEADEIVGGKVRLFGGEPIPLQLTFNEPLHQWTDYETDPKLLTNLYSLVPDIKFLWEPARFGWAFTLGRAYCITQNGTQPRPPRRQKAARPRRSKAEQYAEAFWECFEQFTDGNLPYLGPHWMNGQEVAIRLLALVWAAHVFDGAAASSPERRASLAQSIAQHAARIPPTLVYARSQNNNHLILEATALFTAGVVLEQAQWRRLGWFWLNRALQRQISSYGEYIQHSTNYHRVMLQAALWVDTILRARGQSWPALTLEALARASHWMFSMIDPVSGSVPNLGANDGALIFPLTSCSIADFRPTVQAAARAFLRTGLPSGAWDEYSLWLGLHATGRTADSDAYMAEHLRGRNSWAYLRASSFKSRLSHMDQLHFDLWWRGLNVARDAGTYLYNAEPPWDNPLVSTRVHNTVTVDGHDQMTRGGRFLILDWFPAYSKNLLEGDEQILGRVTANHKGYRRLGILHERVATVFTDEHWQVRDNLTFIKPGTHNFRLHWLLPDWEWKLENGEQRVEIKLKSPHGWITFALQTRPPFSNLHSLISVVRAGELVHGQRDVLPFEGWSSPAYGQKVPALSLAVEVLSSKSFSFVSEFTFPHKP